MEPSPLSHRWAKCVSRKLNSSSKVTRSSEPRNADLEQAESCCLEEELLETQWWDKNKWAQMLTEPFATTADVSILSPHMGLAASGKPPRRISSLGLEMDPTASPPFLSPGSLGGHVLHHTLSFWWKNRMENCTLLLTVSILNSASSCFRNDCINWA